MKNTWFKLIIPLTTLSSCAVGPQYKQPDVIVPLEWSQDVNAMETDPGVWPHADWWGVFQSHELNVLIQEGMEYNYDLQAALSRIYETRAEAIITYSNFYPTLSVTADYEQSKSGAVLSKRHRLFGIASYEVDLWGKLMYERQAAYADVLVSLYDREALRLSIISAIATTYFQILSINDLLDIAEKSVKSFEEVLRIAKARFKLGYSSQLDFLQQETSLRNVQATIPELKQQKAVAINNLQVLVGRIPEHICIDSIGLGSLSLPEALPGGMPSELLERRPDIKSLEERLIAANANIGVATANFFPDFVLTDDFGYRSVKLKDLFNFPNRFYDFVAEATETIFSGFRLEGEYMLAQAQYSELLAEYSQGVISAFRDVENALASIEFFTEEQKILRDAVDDAGESYRLSELSYRQGFADFLFVLSAETTLLNTQEAMVSTTLDRFNAIVSLYTALGGGWCWD